MLTAKGYTYFTGFLLFTVLLIAKLTGAIASSWWLVTLPLWIGPAFVVAITTSIVLLAAVLN